MLWCCMAGLVFFGGLVVTSAHFLDKTSEHQAMQMDKYVDELYETRHELVYSSEKPKSRNALPLAGIVVGLIGVLASMAVSVMSLG